MNAAQTRRTRPGIARRIRTFWIPIVAAAVSFVLGAWLLATTPYFRVKSIGVSRLDHLERAAVISLQSRPIATSGSSIVARWRAVSKGCPM